MSDVTTLATLRENNAMTAAPAQVSQPMAHIGFFDLQSFEFTQRVAKAFASSTLVPATYQGSVANTMLALNMAQRMNADPLMVMQNLNIIHGKPAWSAKFLIATFNSCGRFSAMRFEFNGDTHSDDYCCRAVTTEKATGETLYGTWVSIQMAKEEGWHSKPGSKWKTMPEQMLRYRAASFFIGVYAPEISMGLKTEDEINDIVDAEYVTIPISEAKNVTPPTVVVESTPSSNDDESSDWPQDDDGVLVDARGVPWLAGCHSANKTCAKDGTWRKKRGVDANTMAQLEQEAAIEHRRNIIIKRLENADADTVEQLINAIKDSEVDDSEKDLLLELCSKRYMQLTQTVAA